MFSKFDAYLESIPFFNLTIFGNTLAKYIVAIIIFTFIFIFSHFTKKTLQGKINEYENQDKNKLIHILHNLISVINLPFYFIVSLYFSLRYLDISPTLNTYLTICITTVIYFYLGLGLQKAVESILDALTTAEGGEETNNNGKNNLDPGTADFLGKFISIIIWTILFLIILQNLGFDITALLGGLGIAGIIVAFAMQNILSDIFTYFTINLDKPFKKGDFIIVGNDMGTVTNVGIKNTRIKTLQGQDLVITNKELTNSRINNYTNMERRRVVIKFGVTYSTSVEHLTQIPVYIKDIIDAKQITTFDRAHLKELGEYSINFEVVYHVETPIYDSYMDINQEILLELIKKFRDEKIDFAFPTSTVYLVK